MTANIPYQSNTLVCLVDNYNVPFDWLRSQASCVEIFTSASEKALATGWFVGPNQIVTCAHALYVGVKHQLSLFFFVCIFIYAKKNPVFI